MAEINGIKVPFVPIIREDIRNPKLQEVSGDFDKLFTDELNKIKFSGHAMKRLESRNIKLDDNEINKIQNAVDKARMKGSKDSLVMMNDTAFIVNIPNSTVITALPVSDSEKNVFTNIDSVVIA